MGTKEDGGGRKFSEAGGKLYAVMNWNTRHSNEDVAVLKYLSHDEVSTYKSHKDEGLSDTAVFELMYPNTNNLTLRPSRGGRAAEPHLVRIDTSELSKRQLVRLIEFKLDGNFQSLEAGDRDELEELVCKLFGLVQDGGFTLRPPSTPRQ